MGSYRFITQAARSGKLPFYLTAAALGLVTLGIWAMFSFFVVGSCDQRISTSMYIDACGLVYLIYFLCFLCWLTVLPLLILLSVFSALIALLRRRHRPKPLAGCLVVDGLLAASWLHFLILPFVDR